MGIMENNTGEQEIGNILDNISDLKKSLAAIEKQMGLDIEKIKAQYEDRIVRLKTDIWTSEKDLLKACKKYHQDIFGGLNIDQGATVAFASGTVFAAMITRVKRARSVMGRIEETGKDELLKIIKKVDWDEVEKLSDADLAELGTERIKEVNYDYELKRKEAAS
jgi:phage host-nuclease inhibitor protein Gam